MDIHTSVPLKNFTTMKLGGPARFFVDVRTIDELQTVVRNARSKQLPFFILGGGSNVVAHDEGFQGLIIRIQIPGFSIVSDDINTTVIKIGAGESWDETVKKTVDMQLSGIETLSGIPGTVGGAPVQNIGAYGQELSGTFVSLEAYDTQADALVTLTDEQCEFSYRHSIFRGRETGRYIITSVTLKLTKNLPSPPFYDSLQKYFDSHSITLFTQQAVRDAVLAIRADKLPDPALKPNSGSFFKNAIIEGWQLNELRQTYPDMPSYDMAGDSFKIPTGWLIEKAGFKGQLLHGMRVNDANTLVLINESATSYADLAAARDEIIGKVRDTFRIMIEQEPLEIPTA